VKYAAEMGLGGMIYIPSFIKICSGIIMAFRLSEKTLDRQYVSKHGHVKKHVRMKE
jgi:hypothetical protein